MTEGCMIIGLGGIGMGYDLNLDPQKNIYTHARAFSQHSSFSLLCAVDKDAGRREIFEYYYNKPAYDDISEALKNHNPSIVVLAVPTELHKDTLKLLLNYIHPKIILCEKPLALNIEDSSEMVEICNNLDILLFVNYVRRADPGSIEIKKRIELGEIQNPIKGVVWYTKGFFHNGSHFFNLLEFWLGPFIKATIINNGREFGRFKDPEPDIEIEFKCGNVIFIAAWEEAFSHYTIELISPSGRLRYDENGELIIWQGAESDPNISGYKILNKKAEILENDMAHYQMNIVNEILNAREGRPCHLTSGQESLEAFKSMTNIIKQRSLL